MSISARDRKLLWSRSGGRCALCERELTAEPATTDPSIVVGEECHIYAQSDDGPRGGGGLSRLERDRYENLILLCRDDHRRIDAQPNAWPVALLRDKKCKHEQWVRTRLSDGPESKIVIPPGQSWDEIPLSLCLDGKSLWDVALNSVMGCHWDLPTITDRALVKVVGYFTKSIGDCLLIGDDLELVDLLEMQIDWTEQLDSLKERGYLVYVGRRQCQLQGGREVPSPWPESLISLQPLKDCLIKTEGGLPTRSLNLCRVTGA